MSPVSRVTGGSSRSVTRGNCTSGAAATRRVTPPVSIGHDRSVSPHHDDAPEPVVRRRRGRPRTGTRRGARRAGAGRDPDRPGRRRLAAPGRGARRRRRGRRRGHPSAQAAHRRPRGDAERTGRVVLRGQRAAAHAGAARRAARRAAGAAGHRRRDAERLRPRLPAGRGRGRCRRARDGRAGALGGADRAGRVRAAGRPVLLRGLPAAQGGGAVAPAGRAGRRAAHDGVLRGAAPHRGGAGRDGAGVGRRPGRGGVP